ncbi:MAG: ABC transporter ATP-binding protein [Phycisphaerae bacterium]|nr:ABC transporter ATP-binding protein [Tepidisphaeraceae bacterium]
MSEPALPVEPARPVMVDVRGLSKVYEDPTGADIFAARDVTVSCYAGEIFGLLGPNGAGKTTTLRCLATILTPTHGTATIAGHDLLTAPEAIRRSIGFLSGTTGNYARLTPRETLRFFGSMFGLKGDALESRVEDVLAMFDVTPYADRPNDRLSTGMKQRVGLARAVVHDPPVLILDEPTTGLDPVVSRTVEQAVRRLADAGKCVVFSTHMLHQAEEICDRVGVMARGQLLGVGTGAELCARTGTPDLRHAFFAMIEGAHETADAREMEE